MICPRGGFPFIRHNEVRDTTADLLSQVCHSVGTSLQKVSEEQLTHRSANRQDGAKLDMVVTIFGEEIGNAHFLTYGFQSICTELSGHFLTSMLPPE